MTKEELVKTPEWWLANIQNDLFAIIYEYMEKHHLKRKDIAEKLGVTKGYVSQVLNGDFDHKISKLIELSLAFGKVPKLEFIDIDEYLNQNITRHKAASSGKIEYNIIYEATRPASVMVQDDRTTFDRPINNIALIHTPGALSKELNGYSPISSQ